MGIIQNVVDYIKGLTKVDWIVIASSAGAGFLLAVILFISGTIIAG